MSRKREIDDTEVIIEQYSDSDEGVSDPGFTIEQIDSPEKGAKPTNIQDQEQKVIYNLRKSIVGYLRHIGEDRCFFPDDISDITKAFEKWSHIHCQMTECQSNWSRVRNIFVGSSQAGDLAKKPFPTLTKCPPYNMTAGLSPYQPKPQHDTSYMAESIRMGNAMECTIRESHVALFSMPLKTSKPGQVVATHGIVGMACTGDIELLDEHGDVACLMEVKTLYSAKVTVGNAIPNTRKAAKLYTRDILANHGEFSLSSRGRGNIFRQKSRLVDLGMLKLYGRSHMNALRHRIAVHSHVQPESLLNCCMTNGDVDLYFYNDGDTSGYPAQKFTMSTKELGLTINPWCKESWQMLTQQCVYQACSCKTISKERNKQSSWMHMLLVVPYNTAAVDKPEPYLIIDMPVCFPDCLCEQFGSFYIDSVCKYVDASKPKINNTTQSGPR